MLGSSVGLSACIIKSQVGENNQTTA